MVNLLLEGSKGGGGGGGSSGTRTPDNLRSKDTVEVVLALAEGPIEGLERGAKSFYIGDTQLQNDNGDYNFKLFELKFFPGNDIADPVVPTLGGQTSNTSVNLALGTGVPAVRTTSSTGNIDFIEARIAFQRLLTSNDSGTFNATAEFKIEYKATSSSTWITLFGENISVSGKTSSTYIKEIRWAVPRINGSYDIRVTKISPLNTETFFCDITWESFQEVIASSKSYNNTALVHVLGEASDQFSSIPQWQGIYKGAIVKVPSNYNPTTRVYTGVWDGSWQLAYTNNPAWCLYDFIMNERYGIRSYYLDVNIDKYDVYDAAQWCDQPVPNGEGGTQPRYTFNTLITEAMKGKELARYIAGVFNATFFDDLNGRAYLRVDKDDLANHIFTKENVFDSGFEYTYTDISSRYNDITVTFLNPDIEWQEDRRRIFDQSKIDKHGRIPLDFIAVGCRNAHEAKRRAQYKLITANTETCMVSFSTNRLGAMVKPFDVVLICDPDMGYGISGRVKSFTNSRQTTTLRDPIYLEVGVDYYCSFTLNDGTKLKTKLVDVEPGYNTELNFNGPLPSNLPEKAAFSLEAEGVIGLPRPFRVLKIEEVDGSPDNYRIEGININRNKWNDSDNLVDTGTIDYSTLPSPTAPPGPISCTFEERFVKNKSRFEIIVNPVFNRGAYKYYANDHSFEVWSRPAGTTEAFVKREVLLGDTLINHPYGDYEFRILGKSYLGFTTPIDAAAPYIFNVTNPIAPPKNIDWVKINKREVYWGYVNPPDDFAGFIVRYQNEAGRTTWEDATQPHQGLISSTSFYTQLIPPSARVILVRAVDAFGVTSVESGIIYRDAEDINPSNIVQQIDFHPAWTGTKTGCTVESGALKADDTGTLMYSGTSTALMYDGGTFYGSTYFEMTYETTYSITSPGQLLIDIDFSGSGYEVLTRPTGSLNAYAPIPERADVLVGTYDLFIRVFGGPQRGIINSLSLIVESEELVEDVQDVTITSSGTRIPLTLPFGTIRIVSVIIQDTGASTAVGYRVFDKNPSLGPLIKLVDASGTYVSGYVDAIVKGYA